MRVLFLGNRYNRLSQAALRALVEDGVDVCGVGIHDPLERDGWVRTGMRQFRERGAGFVLSKVAQLARQRLGASRSDDGTLDAVCREQVLVHVRCPSLKPAAIREALADLQPDLIVVAAFSLILGKWILRLPRNGCINVHPSLLPAYRGPNPFYWVLQQGETRTGVTIHHVAPAVDSGDIILQEAHPISPEDTELTLLDRAVAVAPPLLVRAVRLIERHQAPRVPQDASQASYFGHPPRGASRL